MRRAVSTEFIYQALSLVVAIIVVHAVYLTVVRPNAEVILAEQVAAMQEDPDYVQPRSFWVTIRDFEQEACFILMLWAIAIMAYKGAHGDRRGGAPAER